MEKTATPPKATRLHEQILDAVERCFEQFGIQKTTLGEVAKEAGISRMTVYRKFEDREALFRAAALRNIGRQWEDLTAELSNVEHLGEWLVEAMLAFQHLFQDHQVVQLYSRIGGHDEGLRVALSDDGLLILTKLFQPLFDRANAAGHIASGLTENDIAEWIHRTSYTLIVHPSNRLQDKAHLRKWLAAQIIGGLVTSGNSP